MGCVECVGCLATKRPFTQVDTRKQLSPHQHDAVLVGVMKGHICHFAARDDDVRTGVSNSSDLRLHKVLLPLTEVHQLLGGFYQHGALQNKQTLLRTILLGVQNHRVAFY